MKLDTHPRTRRLPHTSLVLAQWPNGALSDTGWSVANELALDDWLKIGQRFGRIGRGIGWWIGDWLRYGNARYGEKYSRAARVTGYDPQTLMNMVYVASQFDIARRRQNLSWSHHSELAALPVDEQEVWLNRAEAEALSVRCLRHELRTVKRAPEAPSQLTATLHKTVCPECGCRFSPSERSVSSSEDTRTLRDA